MKKYQMLLLTFLVTISAYAGEWSAKAKPESDRYPVVEMRAGKYEKDKAKGVIYLTEAQREQTRLIIRAGVVYSSNGQVVSDTKNETAGHRDRINYVMDADGNFYLFDEYKFPLIRHSSIFSGHPVAGAGEIAIKNGHITFIDGNSGHYDSEPLMENVLHELQDDGVDVSRFSGF